MKNYRCVSVVAVLTASAGCVSTASAVLTPFTHNGVEVVHSSESNVTYLANGNLLGTWIAQRGSAAVFADLASVTPSVTLYGLNPPTVRPLAQSDIDGWWGANGATTFVGAVAFINYLNATQYAGVSTWQLPRYDNGKFPNAVISGYTRAGDLGQLYFDEFGWPSAFPNFADASMFPGLVGGQYWTSNDPTSIFSTFGFNMSRGDQYFLNMDFPYFVLPMTTSPALPAPGAAAALGALAIGARRRRR